MKIILDTNFFIDLSRFKVNLEELHSLIQEPYTLATVDSVVNELIKLSTKKTKSSTYAKVALEIIESTNMEVLQTGIKIADNSILSLADKKTLVATNDFYLRKKLKNKGIKTIYIRSKKHLGIS